MRGPALGALIVCCAAGTASAIDVAVVHIGVDDTGGFGIDNAVNFLSADPRFTTVDAIDVDVDGVPSAALLAAYDSILVVTDNRVGVLTGGGLGTQLGNELDDYYLGGGRVVMSAFGGNTDIGIDGDFLGFAPYVPSARNGMAGSLDFGTADLADPVFQNVGSFSSTFASDVDLANGGILVASYVSGEVGIARTGDRGIYLVNGFPATQADYGNGTDFGLVFANALAIPAPTTIAPLGVLGMALLRRRR